MNDRKMVIFLMVLSSVCVLFLCTANLAYKKAARIFNIRLYKVINDMFEIPAQEEEIEKVFLENFEIKEIAGTTYYIAKEKEKGVVLFKAEGPGLWSRIEILLAVSPDRENLYGLRVITQAETPGLGGRIAEKEFQETFKDKLIRPKIKIVKFSSAANEVDAVTGATMTSTSLEEIINKGIQKLDQDMPKAK